MADVLDILSGKYNMEARAGSSKLECPFCGKRTFSIKRDASIAKCFHPNCGKRVTPNEVSPSGLARAYEQFCRDCHRWLLTLTGDTSPRNPYRYLVKDRNIHEQVVRDASIGAVPPGYDPVKELESLLDDGVEVDRMALTTLSQVVKPRENWITFHYADANHLYTAVRFRDPWQEDRSRAFAMVRTSEGGNGLFGHEVFAASGNELDRKLVVVEGEFNVLQLQSLALRAGYSYCFACAVGGASAVDYRAIGDLSPFPVIIHDRDEAGMGVVERASSYFSLEFTTTPEGYKDLDEYILSFGEDYAGAWDAVVKVIAARTPRHRGFEAVAEAVFAARGGKGKEYAVYQHSAVIVTSDLRERGRFHRGTDGNGYYFLSTEKKLMEISDEDDGLTLLLARYGVNQSERLFRYILADMWSVAMTSDSETQVHRFSHYEDGKLYIHNYNSQIYRVTADQIDLVDNGSDGVLFLSEPKWKPFLDKVEDFIALRNDIRTSGESLFDKLIISRINFATDVLSPDERRALYSLWVLANFFRELMPTRPVPVFVGPKGSGKTFTCEQVGRLFFGPRFKVTTINKEKEDDFDVILAASPYVILDNADSRIKWLEDKIAICATGGAIKRRRLYSNMKLVELPVDVFLAVTSRTPKFTRDDVADRSLILKCDRFPEEFTASHELEQELLDNRDRLMAEILLLLQSTLQALRQYDGSSFPTRFRLADFAQFALKLAAHAGYGRRMEQIFDKLMAEQSSFALEGHPLFETLHEWLEDGHEGVRLTAPELCRTLAEFAVTRKMYFPYAGKEHGFAQTLKQLQSNLAQWFKLQEGMSRGRKRCFSFHFRSDNEERRNDGE